jgi:hypothetical protein
MSYYAWQVGQIVSYVHVPVEGRESRWVQGPQHRGDSDPAVLEIICCQFGDVWVAELAPR